MLTDKFTNESEGSIRSFYKGFQPTWKDIIDDIPASLAILDDSYSFINEYKGTERVIPFIGPAGSGKTTLLMQLCYELCRNSEFAVYFLNQPLSQLGRTL